MCSCRQLYTNIERPLQCEWMCGNTTGCTIWTFVAAKPDTGQAPRNCFVKADPFTGQNGWTGGSAHLSSTSFCFL